MPRLVKSCSVLHCTGKGNYGDSKITVCKKHLFAGAVSRYPRCMFPGCPLRRKFRDPEDGKSYCRRHFSGAIASDRCQFPGCDQIASCPSLLRKTLIFCYQHRQDSNIRAEEKCLVEDCDRLVCYGYVGLVDTFCTHHHPPNSYIRKIWCEHRQCQLPASHGFSPEVAPSRCFWHKLPGQIDTQRRECSECFLPYTLDGLYLDTDRVTCYFCLVHRYSLEGIGEQFNLQRKLANYLFHSSEGQQPYIRNLNREIHPLLSRFIPSIFGSNVSFQVQNPPELSFLPFFGRYDLEEDGRKLTVVLKVDCENDYVTWKSSPLVCQEKVRDSQIASSNPILIIMISPHSYVCSKRIYNDPSARERVIEIDRVIRKFWSTNVWKMYPLMIMGLFFHGYSSNSHFLGRVDDEWEPAFF